MLALFLSLPLIACNSVKEVPVHSVSSVYIPQDVFLCKDKPVKPVKVQKADGSMGYRDSDASKFITKLDESDSNCRTQLHSARDIYNRQIEASLNQKPQNNLDSPK